MSWLDYHPLIGPYRESKGLADDDDEVDEWPDDRPEDPSEYDQSYEPDHYEGGCKCCGHKQTQPGQICSCCGVQSG